MPERKPKCCGTCKHWGAPGQTGVRRKCMLHGGLPFSPGIHAPSCAAWTVKRRARKPKCDAASVFTKEELDDLRNGTNRGYIDARDSYMRRTGCSIECAEAAIARWRSVENT